MVPPGVEIIVIDGSSDSDSMGETNANANGLVLTDPPRLIRGADLPPEVPYEDEVLGDPDARGHTAAREARDEREWKDNEKRYTLILRASQHQYQTDTLPRTGKQLLAWRTKLRVDASGDSADSTHVTVNSEEREAATPTPVTNPLRATEPCVSQRVESRSQSREKPRIKSLAQIVLFGRHAANAAAEQTTAMEVKNAPTKSKKALTSKKATTKPPAKATSQTAMIRATYEKYCGEPSQRQNGKQPMVKRAERRVHESDNSFDSDFDPPEPKPHAKAPTPYAKSSGEPLRRQNGKQPMAKHTKRRVYESDDSSDSDFDPHEAKPHAKAPPAYAKSSGASLRRQNGKQPMAKRAKHRVYDRDVGDDEESDGGGTAAEERTRQRSTRYPSLHFLWESTRARWDLPRPSIRDPPARTYGRPYAEAGTSELVPASWPYWIMHFADNFNPDNIRVPGSEPYQKCKCRDDCRHDTCVSAKAAFYCDERSCPKHKGQCGNGLTTNENVRLMRLKNTDIFTLQATKYIGAGVVLGEYLGVLSLVPGERKSRRENLGFRLHFHGDKDAWGSQRLCVDAYMGGSLMRFLNHSCTPSAKFFEVTNRAGRTIVATAIRDIYAGEEITVDYGDDLWFDCQCSTCQIRKAPRKL